jgi:hypothetical protein
VTRGKWIMTNLFGMSPPDPPPNVPPLPARATDARGTVHEPTMREKMLEHRVRADCVQCHRMMDPIGFALENFDAIGLWRTRDEGSAIDASAQLFDNTMVDGPVALRQWVTRYFEPVRARQHREAADLRARPRARLPGHAARALDRARRRARREPVLGAGARGRAQRAVSDEYEDGVKEYVGPASAGPKGHLMSFVMKKQIPRRLFLRGAGVTLALPLLDAMTPAMAQSPVVGKPRFVGIFFPHGMAPGPVGAAGEGALPDKLPFVLESLEAVKNQTTVITGCGRSRRSRRKGRPDLITGWRPRISPASSRARPRGGRDGRQPDDRSAHRAEDRRRHAAAVAAAGGRGSELQLEQLRRRLQLLVHQLDLVDRACRRRLPSR